MKIAVVVHGRWDAFDLARELLARGHDVTLFTNYPAWAVQRFGVSGKNVRSGWWHGVLCRVLTKARSQDIARHCEPALHTLFGRWASIELDKEGGWDVAYLFSGVAEESLRRLAGGTTLRVLVRESAHIRAQERLLRDEERRTGFPQDRPSQWIIAREEREYALADAIRVLSSFTYDTFRAEGVPPAKLWLVLSGAHLDHFRPQPDVVEVRCRRILSGAPLRILTVGTFSFRKGVWDTATIVRELGNRRFEFSFVGPIAPEAAPLSGALRSAATFVPKQPQSRLPDFYAWGDLFLLPTIEDGFQAVLAQAAASALPILTTPNGAGRDLVRDGQTGWVLPIRSPRAFVERLSWADTHRDELAAMVRSSYERFQPRDFAEVAADLEARCMEHLSPTSRLLAEPRKA